MNTCSLSSSLFSFQPFILVFVWIVFRLSRDDIVIASLSIVYRTFFLNLVFVWAGSPNAELTNLRAALVWQLRDSHWLLGGEYVLLLGVLGVVHLVRFGPALLLMGLKHMPKPPI